VKYVDCCLLHCILLFNLDFVHCFFVISVLIWFVAYFALNHCLFVS